MHTMPHPPQFDGSEDVALQAPAQRVKPVTQVNPQLVPSHVAAAFAGVGQAVHMVPQVSGDALLAQVIPHG